MWTDVLCRQDIADRRQLHPWFQQRDIVSYCEQEGIPIEAYCPLVRQEKADDANLVDVAKKCGKTPNQVLIRYALQKGWIPLPKSENPERIASNADVYDFEIPKAEMKKLDDLDQGRQGKTSTSCHKYTLTSFCRGDHLDSPTKSMKQSRIQIESVEYRSRL